MKLIYCIAATYNSGGMERVLCNKTNYWIKQGHEVHIVTTDQNNRSSFFEFDERIHFHDLGINYEETNGASFLKKSLAFVYKQKKHKERLSRLLSELKGDIVFSMFNNDVNFIADIQDGSKKVLEIHFSKNKKILYGRKGLWHALDVWRTKKEERLVRKFDRFVVLTHQDALMWKSGNMQVIPNPLKVYPSQTADLEKPVVLAIGRLEYQKGFERLLDVWAKVSPNASGWKLHIVGQGDLKEDLQRQIQTLGLSDSAFLVEPNPNVAQFYLNASIFAMTSRYEGLPMVLLEAQSYSLPAISYDIECGPQDIIGASDSGFVIPDGDEERFAEKLSLLMQDLELRKRMGANALENSKNFSEDKVMAKWETLLKELCKK